MSNPPPRPGASSGVYIPPRRNAPVRPSPNGGPMPGAAGHGPPMGAYPSNPAVMIHPRTGSAVNIPARNLSAAGLPERSGSVSRPFQAPPRTVIPHYPGGVPTTQAYVPPHPSSYTPSPTTPYGYPAPYNQPPNGYAPSAGPYTPPAYNTPTGGYVQPGSYGGGGYVQPGANSGGYVQPGSAPLRPSNTPAPRVASLIASNNYPNHNFAPEQASPVDQLPRRRPSSIADASSLYNYAEPSTPRPTSFDETARPFDAYGTEPARTGGPTIPKRLGSNVPITVDDLLDAGGAAFAAPRHNIEEALAKWRQARNLAVENRDYIREAKALANIGAALRVQGKLNDSLNELRTAWDVTTRYVTSASARQSSVWLQLVMLHADIDSDTESAEDPSFSSVGGGDKGPDVSQGPPIVVWYLQLTTNLGNAHFSLGQYQEAIQYHDMCRRLAEAVMEEYPLPASCPPPALRSASSKSTSSTDTPPPSTPVSERADSFASSAPTLVNSPRIKLSYLHRQTLLAHARALTHLALCHQQLGLDDEALDNNLKAELLVTFYSNKAQLSQSFQTRRSSLSTPYSQHLEVQAAEAAIIANVGTSYHAKGRLPSALSHHEKALKLFRNLPDEQGIAKESINVGCLYMEVGKILNSLHWIRDMDVASHHGGEGQLEACKRYWGPPRLDGVNIGEGAVDEGAPEIAGKGMFDMGMVALYEEERVFRIHNDWHGLMCVWLNLAVGYVLLHQPYLALYYLAKMTPDPDASATTTSALSSTPPTHHTPQILRRHPGSIPHFLHPHIHFTLCQTLFILTRMQEFHPEQPLFPEPEGDAIPDHGTKLPVMDPALLRSLMEFLGVDSVGNNFSPATLNQESVIGMLERCKSVLHEVERVRSQVAQILLAGGGVGFDVVKQKGVVGMSTEGKVEWSLGGVNGFEGHYGRAGELFEAGGGRGRMCGEFVGFGS
ncbi:hypothetical protein HDV00_002645 [Rhizophlyctis rosea]|nr:hypothetical protein HDV00_002645 [Rhizophlyctis rosea]